MFNRILLATDLSGAGDRLVRTVGGLKALGTREVILVHALNFREEGMLLASLMEQAKPELEREADLLRGQDLEVKAETVIGAPHTMINQMAEENDCSLIVVGSHGRTMATDIMLGGVANAVTHNATRPVLILRMRLKDENGEPTSENISIACEPLEHVLFPTDFSENAQKAFEYLKEMCAKGLKRATLFHVQDSAKLDPHLAHMLDEFNKIDTERVERLQAELKECGAQEIRLEMPFGSPKKEILDRSNQDDVSLVIMGSQGRGFFAELLLGSVSYSVARRCKAPVLLIPLSKSK